MKKVLLTVNNNKLSGIENFTLLLARYLDKSLFSVEVGVPVYGQFCELLKKNGVKYFIFDNKITGKYTLNGIKYLYRKIRAEKYDIIHAQAGIAPCVIGKMLGTRLLIEHKHGLDFTINQIENMNFLKFFYQNIKRYFVHLTLTGCEADKKILTDSFRYDNSKVRTVYNGIESKKPNIKKTKNAKFLIGSIGRLTFQKGQEYFIEMAGILKKKGNDFEYHIYGEGENKDYYMDLIDKNNLNENVFLKGYSENISGIMNSLDLLVLSSRYEGIPYVILEAMKWFVPVISTNVGGICEVIENNVNGILVEKQSGENLAENLAEKTILLYNSENLRKKLTFNANKDFNEKFTLEKTMSDIESIYSEIENY